MDPFIPIEVKNYSLKEAHSFLEYLADRKFLMHPYGKSIYNDFMKHVDILS